MKVQSVKERLKEASPVCSICHSYTTPPTLLCYDCQSSSVWLCDHHVLDHLARYPIHRLLAPEYARDPVIPRGFIKAIDCTAAPSVIRWLGPSLESFLLCSASKHSRGIVRRDGELIKISGGAPSGILNLGYDSDLYDKEFMKPGQLNGPAGICSFGDDEIYVSDQDNDRIQVFSKSFEEFRSMFGKKGYKPGEFNAPAGIAVDAKRIFVVDSGNHRVQVFTRNTFEFESTWGYLGSDSSCFKWPMGIAIDGNLVFVADTRNRRVQCFEYNSILGQATFLCEYGSQDSSSSSYLRQPVDVAVNFDEVAVLDSQNRTVVVFSKPRGELLDVVSCHYDPDDDEKSPVTTRTSSGNLVDIKLTSLCMDQDRIFVCDEANNKILVLGRQ